MKHIKHNEQFANIALELMRDRLAELRAKASLNDADKKLLTQLSALVESRHTAPCTECCGVGVVRFAYATGVGTDKFVIARADEDQPGHLPQPHLGSFPSYEAAANEATYLNQLNGLDQKTAFGIVASTIREQHRREA
jgi:hypothetical protein